MRMLPALAAAFRQHLFLSLLSVFTGSLFPPESWSLSLSLSLSLSYTVAHPLAHSLSLDTRVGTRYNSQAYASFSFFFSHSASANDMNVVNLPNIGRNVFQAEVEPTKTPPEVIL